MFTNYSETYAAAIATFAPIIVILLSGFNIVIPTSELIVFISAGVSFVGFVWQLFSRYQKGGINIIGARRE